jgi:hypothetical protein
MKKHDHDHRITNLINSHKILNDSGNISVVQWDKNTQLEVSEP